MQASARMRRAVLLVSLGAGAAALAPACGSGSTSSDPDGGAPGADAGDPTALDCEPQSGSRLRRVVRQHDDGSSSFLRFYDSDVGEVCVFRTAGDGTLRCAPVADGNPVAPGRVMYSDAACTVRIARLDGGLGEVAPVLMQQEVLAPDTCSVRVQHYALGNQLAVSPGVTTLYTSDGAACNAVTADSNPYFEITGEPTLVEGTEAWVGGRLTMRRIDGEDGSRFCDDFGDLRDSSFDGHMCNLQFAEDGAVRCLPWPRSTTAVFADAACTSVLQVAITSASCDSGARFTVENIGSCLRRRIRALGEEVTDPIYTMSDMCVQAPLEEGQRVYRVGPAVSASSFAAFERSWVDLGGRLERGDLDDGLGLRLFRFTWRDRMIGDVCTFETAADGVERCLPADLVERRLPAVTTGFTDAGCTVPVLVATADLSCTEEEPAFAYQDVDGGRRIYPVVGPAAGPLYVNNGGCVQVDVSSYYAVGAEIDPSSFVGSETVTE